MCLAPNMLLPKQVAYEKCIALLLEVFGEKLFFGSSVLLIVTTRLENYNLITI